MHLDVSPINVWDTGGLREKAFVAKKKPSKHGTGGLTMNKCGDCVFLEKEDGFPYCVTLPLYTERDPDDAACEYFVDRRADDGRK
jgi:hypothetical protein